MKKLAILCLVLMLMLAFTPVVLADGSITIQGDTLSVTPRNFAFNAVTLDGGDQTAYFGDTSVDPLSPAEFAPDWRAIDPTGTGNGWRVNISATDFACDDTGAPGDDGELCWGHVIAMNGVEGGFSARMLTADIATIDGLDDPDDPVSDDDFDDSYWLLSGSAQRFIFAAADDGMGTYDFDPDFRLFIPAETYAGAYTSTVTVTILSGPGS